MNSDSTTRIAFVGAGGIASRHADVLSRMPDVQIVAVADQDIGRAEEFAARYGAEAGAHHHDILGRGDIDAVYICVPPFAHGAIEDDVIDAGLPFFVEKPLSLDIELAERISARIDDTGLITAVGYHWRYLDTVEEAKATLSGNAAALVVGHWLDQTPPPKWWWRKDHSGGQVVEQATHIIDLARHLAGEISEVHAVSGKPRSRDQFPGLDVSIATAVSLRFASGAVGTLAATCLLGWNHRSGLHVFADRLAIELSDHDIMVDVGEGRPIRRNGSDPVEREDREFINAVSGRAADIRCTYAEALKSHRVALAIERSAEAGQPIYISS